MEELDVIQRWKGICAYDGTDFCGWQSQSSRNAVQDVLEIRLREILKKDIRVHGSSRTDAGVHAEKQTFHFDAKWKYETEKLFKALTSGLRSDLQILSLQPIDQCFHSRFSAKRKRYRYEIYFGTPSPFDVRYCWAIRESKRFNFSAIEKSITAFLGEHNFSAFAGKVLTEENPIKILYRFDLKLEGPHLTFWSEGSGYLYRMVRMLVGALMDVGRGRVSDKTLATMLDSGKSLYKITAAPATGLFLEEVIY